MQDDCEILSTFDTALDVPNEDATQAFLFLSKMWDVLLPRETAKNMRLSPSSIHLGRDGVGSELCTCKQEGDHSSVGSRCHRTIRRTE